MSATQPVLQKIFKDIFSVNAAAVEDLILQYAPEGTTDIALKANVTASSTYNSAEGKWHLDRINDGAFTFNGIEYTNLSEISERIVTVDDKDYYLMTVELPAAEALKTVKLVATVSVGESTATGTFSFSIPKYAEKVIALSQELLNK